MTRIFLLGRGCPWISACNWKLHLKWNNLSTIEAMFLHGDQILKARRTGKSMWSAGKHWRGLLRYCCLFSWFQSFWWLSAEESKRCKRHGLDPWVGKIPWRRKWQLAPGFLPGEFQGQWSLVGYSPWGCKESDTTEHGTAQRVALTISKPTLILAQGREGQPTQLTTSQPLLETWVWKLFHICRCF